MLLYQEGPVFCSLDAFRVPTSPSFAQQIPWGIRVLAPTKERPDWESHSPSVEDDRNSPGTDCPIQGFLQTLCIPQCANWGDVWQLQSHEAP